ncbi:MAG: hypothetical protein IH949_11890 [Bacteroidetes bacterium]|nr:hypothetical protein [Bacteroidota bacterium]
MKQLNFINSFTANNQYQILLWEQITIKLIIKSTAQRLIKETGVHIPPTLPYLYKPFIKELAEYGFEFKKRTVQV